MGKKILIIEDEQTLSKALMDVFSKENYKLEIAIDGEDGWEKAQEIKPDLIMLDLILPKMDGFVLLQKLKANNRLKNIPVIILTNLSEVTDKCERLGAEVCLVKSDHSMDDIKKIVMGALKK